MGKLSKIIIIYLIIIILEFQINSDYNRLINACFNYFNSSFIEKLLYLLDITMLTIIILKIIFRFTKNGSEYLLLRMEKKELIKKKEIELIKTIIFILLIKNLIVIPFMIIKSYKIDIDLDTLFYQLFFYLSYANILFLLQLKINNKVLVIISMLAIAILLNQFNYLIYAIIFIITLIIIVKSNPIKLFERKV